MELRLTANSAILKIELASNPMRIESIQGFSVNFKSKNLLAMLDIKQTEKIKKTIRRSFFIAFTCFLEKQIQQQFR